MQKPTLKGVLMHWLLSGSDRRSSMEVTPAGQITMMWRVHFASGNHRPAPTKKSKESVNKRKVGKGMKEKNRVKSGSSSF